VKDNILSTIALAQRKCIQGKYSKTLKYLHPYIIVSKYMYTIIKRSQNSKNNMYGHDKLQKWKENNNYYRKSNTSKLKLLQARFDWACSSTVLESTSYRRLTLAQGLKQNSTWSYIWICKHLQMGSYGGNHGTFNEKERYPLCQTLTN
jgi:hypothetical protein